MAENQEVITMEVTYTHLQPGFLIVAKQRLGTRKQRFALIFEEMGVF